MEEVKGEHKVVNGFLMICPLYNAMKLFLRILLAVFIIAFVIIFSRAYKKAPKLALIDAVDKVM